MTESTPVHPSVSSRIGALRLGDPHIHGSIGLWPVFAPEQPEPRYIPLVDALAIEGFQITEVSEGGSVPNLRVVNRTDHNVLLFDGEELKGAKQNRILNTSILIAAGSTLDVPVSCTERGRWGYNSTDFSSSGSFAHAELRKAKSASVMFSLEEKKGHQSDQGQVWSEIEALHEAANSSEASSTRAMKDAYNLRQRDLDEFARGMSYQPGQCGLLAVAGDRVEGVDVLSDAGVYQKLHLRLVESHAMDFLVLKGGKRPKPLDPAAPERFLKAAAMATQSTHASPGMGADHRLRFNWGHGAALQVGESTVHLALFGGNSGGGGGSPMEPRILRRRRG